MNRKKIKLMNKQRQKSIENEYENNKKVEETDRESVGDDDKRKFDDIKDEKVNISETVKVKNVVNEKEIIKRKKIV